MSNLKATVLLQSSFTTDDSGRVTEILRNAVTDVSETRGRRAWWFRANEGVALLSVRSTLDVSLDIEDELLAKSFDFDNAADAFVLSFSTRHDSDHDVCGRLAAELAESFCGFNCGFDS